MPHSTNHELGVLVRALETAANFLTELRLGMATDDGLTKLMGDSTTTIETNNQGIMTVVFDFAPTAARTGPDIDKLHAAITSFFAVVDKKEHRAGGKYHSVWEVFSKHRGRATTETLLVRTTHAGGTSSLKEDRADGGLL